jgi:hypothetical protein
LASTLTPGRPASAKSGTCDDNDGIQSPCVWLPSRV